MKKINLTLEQERIFKQCVAEHKTLHQIAVIMHKDSDVIRRLARDYNIQYLQEHYSYTEDQTSQIRYLYENTDLSIYQISKKLKLYDVAGYIWDNYSCEYRDARHRRLLSKQKMGDKNPMYGMCAQLHHNYKGLCSDGKGYFTVTRPSWYTGDKCHTRVFIHHVIMCEHLCITEIPNGYVVHHIDFNPSNNDIDNLSLMTNSAHTKLHAMIRKLQKL